jgi:hypothetical protein
MAEFLPPSKGSSDPSYIGFSRETSGNTALPNAIKGVSDLVGTGVRVYDEHIRNKLAVDLKAGVAGVNETVVPKSANEEVQESEDEEEGDAVDLFSTDQTSSNPDISRGGTQASRLTSAYRQGKLSSTAYWGKMAALSKELKARYPGYADEVDKQFQGHTGQIPANALAASRRKEYTASVASVNSEEKMFNRFVQTNIGYLPADYFQRVKEGNPYDKLEVYETVAKRKARDLENNAIKDNLSIAANQGNLTQENAVGAASDALNSRASAILSNVTSKQLVDKITQAQASGASVSPQELEQVRAAWGLLRIKAEQALEEELRKPNSDGGYTWYSLIKDPSKVKAIREQALQQFDSLQNMLDNKDFGSFAATLNANKAMEASTKNELLKRPFWRFMDAAASMGNRELLSVMMTKPGFMSTMGQEAKASLDMLTAQMAAGDKTPMATQIQQVQQSTKGNKEDAKRVTREVIANNIVSLTSDKATMSAKEAAAERMFGQGNENILTKVANTTQRKELYNRMVSPIVTKSMAEVRQTKPELWSNYVNWSKQSFLALQKANIQTMQEGVENRENIDIEWSGNRFVVKNLQPKKGSLISGVENAMQDTTVMAVSDLNKQIALLEEVLKVDGGDVSAELSTLFGAMGIDTNAQKSPTVYQKARKALDLYLNPPEPEGKKPQ